MVLKKGVRESVRERGGKKIEYVTRAKGTEAALFSNRHRRPLARMHVCLAAALILVCQILRSDIYN